MLKFFRTFFRGFGYHEEYGYHAGHGVMIFLLALGGAAGSSSGRWEGVVIGIGIFGLVFGVPYLITVYFHGRDILEYEMKKRINNEEIKSNG